ncbi:MAG: hypothetical protein CVT68_02175, partial [Actinobacteria bacterium HGW-Actinobacteria-8]
MATATYTARYLAERPSLHVALDQWLEELTVIARSVDLAASVTGRVKSHRSILKKVFRDLGTARDWSSLGDLVALKAIFPTTRGVDAFTALLCAREDWHPVLEVKKAAPNELKYESKQFDLWRADVLDSTGTAIKTEVQVRTAASDAWYIVDHRLRYKGIVTLPEAVERKVLRLTVLAELFDQEVEAILESQSTLAEYAVSRAYEYLTHQVDHITDGLAMTSRPDGLLETILTAYKDEELEELERIIQAFVSIHSDELKDVVHAHQYDHESFVEQRDWLYTEPEAILIAERTLTRPALLAAAAKDSNY